jgi:hypothetical protein
MSEFSNGKKIYFVRERTTRALALIPLFRFYQEIPLAPWTGINKK